MTQKLENIPHKVKTNKNLQRNKIQHKYSI